MGKKSRMSILKRQRELKKSDKAAAKRARRHGVEMTPNFEPRPTVSNEQLMGLAPMDDPDDASQDASTGDAEKSEA